MDAMTNKMTTVFSDSATFTSEMQKTMATNNVTSVSPSAVTADTSAVPQSAGTMGADKTTINDDNKESDNAGGIIAAVVIIFVLGGLAVGGFLWYSNKKKDDHNHQQNTDDADILSVMPIQASSGTEMTFNITNPANNKKKPRKKRRLSSRELIQQTSVSNNDDDDVQTTTAAEIQMTTVSIVNDVDILTDDSTGKQYSYNKSTGETK